MPSAAFRPVRTNVSEINANRDPRYARADYGHRQRRRNLNRRAVCGCAVLELWRREDEELPRCAVEPELARRIHLLEQVDDVVWGARLRRPVAEGGVVGLIEHECAVREVGRDDFQHLVSPLVSESAVDCQLRRAACGGPPGRAVRGQA